MSETATDFIGQTYGVGDFVVYATTSGRSPIQKYARVEKVEHVDDVRTEWHHGPEGGWVRREIPHKRLRVGVREVANGREFSTNARVSYPMPENIVRVSEGDK